jgi:hypothetical protein
MSLGLPHEEKSVLLSMVLEARNYLRGSEFAKSFVVPASEESTRLMFFFGNRSGGARDVDQVAEIELESVRADVEISMDLKPGSCPNRVNLHSKGVMPVAVPGSDSFDVYSIEPDTILLAGISPLRYSYEDVTAPYIFEGEAFTALDCSTEAAGDTMDLVLKFDTQEVREALEESYGNELVVGEEILLHLTGELIGSGGTPATIHGQDYLKVLRNLGEGSN